MTAEATYPEVVHFLGPKTILLPGPLFGSGVVCEYGQELAITPEIIELQRDRNGNDSWLAPSFINSDTQQLVRPGPWPEGKPRIEVGSQRWVDEREAQRQAAHAIKDEAERDELLRRVNAKYGVPPPTSRTLADYRPDDQASAW